MSRHGSRVHGPLGRIPPRPRHGGRSVPATRHHLHRLCVGAGFSRAARAHPLRQPDGARGAGGAARHGRSTLWSHPTGGGNHPAAQHRRPHTHHANTSTVGTQHWAEAVVGPVRGRKRRLQRLRPRGPAGSCGRRPGSRPPWHTEIRNGHTPLRPRVAAAAAAAGTHGKPRISKGIGAQGGGWVVHRCRGGRRLHPGARSRRAGIDHGAGGDWGHGLRPASLDAAWQQRQRPRRVCTHHH
jgi:hypothetical protein